MEKEFTGIFTKFEIIQKVFLDVLRPEEVKNNNNNEKIQIGTEVFI